MTPLEVDERLRAYATDSQWAHYLVYIECGSFRAAAVRLGLSHDRVRLNIKALFKKAARQGYAPAFDLTHEVPDGLALKGTSIRYDGAGNVQQYWNKTKVAGREPEETVQLPDPKTIAKVSSLYDQEGRVVQQWVAEKPAEAARVQLWRDFAKELAQDLPRAAPVPPPGTRQNLLVCYPVGDHHLGMLSWKKETGESYDMDIAENMLNAAVSYLTVAAPSSDNALIAFLGDFMHYDSFETVTPTSRNRLDADGRYPRMVRAAIRSMRTTIGLALQHHGKVHVIVEIGNHDLSSSIFLMECLANIYENEPRITVDTSPMHFHYYEFGKVLIGTHHGHGPKMEQLPMIMAADRPEAWGRTTHRYWWTGHRHAKSVMDFAGCSVEQFRILPPTDAWAQQQGYRPIRDMTSIIIHPQHGECGRILANPEMFR